MKKKGEKSKKIGIEDLAKMVAAGFSSVEERMDKMEAKIDVLEVKLDKTNEKLDRIEDRTITLKNHMENGFNKKFAW